MNKNLLVIKSHFYEDSNMSYSCSYKFWPSLTSDQKNSEAAAYADLVQKANNRIKELEWELVYLKQVMKGAE